VKRLLGIEKEIGLRRMTALPSAPESDWGLHYVWICHKVPVFSGRLAE
jgi:hypothetical protein